MRLFQYLVGENRGKVVALKEIDDVSKQDMVLYVFDDGFKCNAELVETELNIPKAVDNHMVMAAVENRQNVWKFRETKVEEQKLTGRYQNQEFEIPDPYFVDKDGKRAHEAKTVITPVPPRKAKSEPEPLDGYYISAKRAEKNPEPEAAPAEEKYVSGLELKPDIPENNPIARVATVCEKFSYDLDERELTIDATDPEWFSDKSVRVLRKSAEDTIEDFYNMSDLINIGLKAVDDTYAEEDAKEGPSFGPAVMLDNCRKSPAEVSMTLTLQLPPVDAYRLIKENYPEEWTSEFIMGIIMKLSTKDIRDSLSKGLSEMYESALAKSGEAREGI